MSFAYDVLEDDMVQLDDGTKAHELRKLDLFECSIVTVPANDNAQITEVKESGMHKQKVGRRRFQGGRGFHPVRNRRSAR